MASFKHIFHYDVISIIVKIHLSNIMDPKGAPLFRNLFLIAGQ